eukprot:UN07907
MKSQDIQFQRCATFVITSGRLVYCTASPHGWHPSCVHLLKIPEGDDPWYCPVCVDIAKTNSEKGIAHYTKFLIIIIIMKRPIIYSLIKNTKKIKTGLLCPLSSDDESRKTGDPPSSDFSSTT